MHLELSPAWDKVFEKSEKVEHCKDEFRTTLGTWVACDVYKPKGAQPGDKLAAIAVSGPYGAVKEQSSGLYAQQMAERGFLAVAFDPSTTGESGGYPRYMTSPSMNSEDFMAAVDYLSNRDDVDPERIGIIGICGWGGMALNTAAIDPRIKATVASTMYDMTENAARGYFNSEDSAQARSAKRKAFAEARTQAYATGVYPRIGGVPDALPDDAPDFFKGYHAYYKTERGYHPRSLNSNDGWTAISFQQLLNQPILCWAGEIEAPVLVVHGENAHSLSYSREAFAKLKGDNKELVVVPGATHCDLYDDPAFIPFSKIEEFFKANL